jgi:hypothetical protein
MRTVGLRNIAYEFGGVLHVCDVPFWLGIVYIVKITSKKRTKYWIAHFIKEIGEVACRSYNYPGTCLLFVSVIAITLSNRPASGSVETVATV